MHLRFPGAHIGINVIRACQRALQPLSVRHNKTARCPISASRCPPTRQGAAGVPLYLWYAPGGEAEQLPQVLTPDLLVRKARASEP